MTLIEFNMNICPMEMEIRTHTHISYLYISNERNGSLYGS